MISHKIDPLRPLSCCFTLTNSYKSSYSPSPSYMTSFMKVPLIESLLKVTYQEGQTIGDLFIGISVTINMFKQVARLKKNYWNNFLFRTQLEKVEKGSKNYSFGEGVWTKMCAPVRIWVRYCPCRLLFLKQIKVFHFVLFINNLCYNMLLSYKIYLQKN